MYKKITLILLTLILTTSLAIAQWEGEWKLPFIPVALTYNTEDGFGIKGTASMLTPIGEFSISTPTYKTSSSSSEQGNKRINERVIVEKPVYVDRIIYKDIKYVDRIVKVPTIKEVIKIKEVIVKEKEYLLVIRNRHTNRDMLFIIKGIDEFEAELDGHTSILAKEGQVIIDVTDAEISQVKFRGRSIENPESLSDNIFTLCNRYNNDPSNFGKNGAKSTKTFLFKKDYFPNKVDNYRKILSDHKIFSSRYDVISIARFDDSRQIKCEGQDGIASLDQVLIFTDKGVFWNLINIKRKFLKTTIKTKYIFTTWEDFSKIEFSQMDECLIAISGLSSDETYYIRRSALSTHELNEFFKLLQETIKNRK